MLTQTQPGGKGPPTIQVTDALKNPYSLDSGHDNALQQARACRERGDSAGEAWWRAYADYLDRIGQVKPRWIEPRQEAA